MSSIAFDPAVVAELVQFGTVSYTSLSDSLLSPSAVTPKLAIASQLNDLCPSKLVHLKILCLLAKCFGAKDLDVASILRNSVEDANESSGHSFNDSPHLIAAGFSDNRPSAISTVETLPTLSNSPSVPGNDVTFTLCSDLWVKDRTDVSTTSSTIDIDVDHVILSINSFGRFDAYILAEILVSIEKSVGIAQFVKATGSIVAHNSSFPGNNDESSDDNHTGAELTPFKLPFFVPTIDVADARGKEARRVYTDATVTWVVTPSKEQWYMTLLASGTPHAIQEALQDLEVELWHAQFNKYCFPEATQRLQKILVSILGSSDDTIKTNATAMLHCLIDGHDWQRNVPLLPRIQHVGDDFSIDLYHYDTTVPQDVCLILVRPVADHHIYDYVKLDWSEDRDGMKQTSHKAVFNRAPARRCGGVKRYHAKINFGKFSRCGFYDWRLVRCVGGSFATVLSSIEELTMNYRSSFSLASLINNEDVDAGRNIWSEIGGNPQSLPVQGRFIVHQAGLKKQQLHELTVDIVTSDSVGANGQACRGDFYSLADRLESLRDNGITTVLVNGALARDNGAFNYETGEWERCNASQCAPTCRASACEMMGGDHGFSTLVTEARRLGMRIVVEGISQVSASGAHRKYSPYELKYSPKGGCARLRPFTQDKGCFIESGESVHLNYRNSDVWGLFIKDIKDWVTKHEVDGVKLDLAHLMPHMYPVAEDELNRVDPDRMPHYDLVDKMLGTIVTDEDPSKPEGYWGSTAQRSHYSNPFLAMICRELWSIGDIQILGDTPTLNDPSRLGCLARSGVVPLSRKVPEILAGLYGKQLVNGVYKNKEADTVEELTRFMIESHDNMPEGAILVQASMDPTSAYPALVYGKGAWAAADFLFLSADLPCTQYGEDEGKAFRVGVTNLCIGDVSVNRNITDSVHTIHTLEGLAPLSEEERLQNNVLSQLPSESGFDLTKIGEHYRHRRTVRAENPLLVDGHMVPLKPLSVDGTPLKHVFAACRYNQQLEMMIYGVNFSEHPVEANVSIRFLDMTMLENRKLRGSQIVERYDILSGSEYSAVEAIRNNNIDAFATDKLQLLTVPELLNHHHNLNIAACGSQLVSFRLAGMPSASDPRDRDMNLALYVSSLVRLEKFASRAQHEISTTGSISDATIGQIETAFIVQRLKQVMASTDMKSFVEYLVQIAAASNWRIGAGGACFDIYKLLVDCEMLADVTEEAPVCPVPNPTSQRPTNAPPSPLDSDVEDDAAPVHRRRVIVSRYDFFGRLERVQEFVASHFGPVVMPEDNDMTHYTLCDLLKSTLEATSIGPIVFFTSELGKYSTVGGLGVMVDELAYTMANQLGFEPIVVSPYYNFNRKNQTYALDPEIKYIQNVLVTIKGVPIEFGVHYGVVKGVRLVFLHHMDIFPTPYPDHGPEAAVTMLTAFGKGFLEALCALKIIPTVIVTNDWATGLAPAYARCGFFGDIFDQTKFLHVLHNFDSHYEGRIYTNGADYCNIHGLPRDLLVDPMWKNVIVNPSRCALLCADQWGTVSPSYKAELMYGDNRSPLHYLLNGPRFPAPFATPNGVNVLSRQEKLKGTDHISAKLALQQKYFGFADGDASIPLFAFIGRVTSQKGVHLILQAAETMIQRHQNRIQILVGGMVNWKDPYSADCGRRMRDLKARYPWSFWCAPDSFFTDGSLVNIGADFGLMPSLFEPGGIVQQEFFVAGTPVIAFRTGGLKDTVFEYSVEKGTGNGLTFDSYTLGDFIHAWERSMRIFSSERMYSNIRNNAKNLVVSTEDCAKNWVREICRIAGRVMIEPTLVKDASKRIPPLTDESIILNNVPGLISRATGDCSMIVEEDDDVSDCEVHQNSSTPDDERSANSTSSKRRMINRKVVAMPTTLKYRVKSEDHQSRPRSVAVSGSFDGWKVRHPMRYDVSSQCFVTFLALRTGTYQFKIVVDGDWVCSSEHPTQDDGHGVDNNVVTVDI